jgi:hypothetical protein
MAPKKSSKKADEVRNELVDEDPSDYHQTSYSQAKQKQLDAHKQQRVTKTKAINLAKSKDALEKEISQSLESTASVSISSRQTSRISQQSVSSLSSPRSLSMACSNSSIEEEPEEKLARMLLLAKKQVFPTKIFEKNGKSFEYTSYLNWTTSSVSSESNEKIKFKCLFCEVTISCVLGKTTNIKSHLELQHKTNKRLMEWFDLFNKNNNRPHNKTKIDDATLKLVKYFIASNTAASEFDSPFFRDCFSLTPLKIPCAKTFSTIILPDVMNKLNEQLERELKKAASICFISDIWSSRQLASVNSIAGNLINENFEKSTIVIGMCEMPGSHTAENIKDTCETIVNQFTFDKSTIHGNYSFTNHSNEYLFML